MEPCVLRALNTSPVTERSQCIHTTPSQYTHLSLQCVQILVYTPLQCTAAPHYTHTSQYSTAVFSHLSRTHSESCTLIITTHAALTRPPAQSTYINACIQNPAHLHTPACTHACVLAHKMSCTFTVGTHSPVPSHSQNSPFFQSQEAPPPDLRPQECSFGSWVGCPGSLGSGELPGAWRLHVSVQGVAFAGQGSPTWPLQLLSLGGLIWARRREVGVAPSHPRRAA